MQAEFIPVFERTAPSESASETTFSSPEVNCRPPLGSQKCDSVDESSVRVQIASRIHSSVWTDSSERERDSGANLWSPEVNCRPPLGSQKCDTVYESSVCVQIEAEFTPVFERAAPSESAILVRIVGPLK